MAITMREQFLVRAAIEDVWDFLMDPHCVVACTPGAHLQEVESERAFTGSIKVAIGPFVTSYKGRVEFVEVDETEHRARLTAEGHERNGGAARGSMVSFLTAVEGGTEVVVDVSVEGTSKLVHMGLSLTQNLSEELFGQFANCVRERLEQPHGDHTTLGGDDVPEPVQVFPLLAKAFLRRFRAKDPAK